MPSAPDEEPEAPPRRPRIAFVVNNEIWGDSRVQRIAAAATEAGWEALVIGRSPDGKPRAGEHRGWRWHLVTPPPVRRTFGFPTLPRAARRVLARRDVVAGHSHRPWAHGGWRVFDPWIGAFELAAVDPLEEYEPQVIHAHDRHPVPLVARSVAELRARGRDVVWVLDAHEDVRATADRGASGLRGWARRRMVAGEEAEWIGEADAVVTVSDELAQTLRSRHHLGTTPTVVLNAPASPPRDAHRGGRSLRAALALAPDVPLLVYSGSCAPARGVATGVEALTELPGVHLAVVASPTDAGAGALVRRAAELGVADRVHRVDYVAADAVLDLLRGADAGLIPLLHRPNHEISLVTKYLEYLHSGLPVVCSSVRTMATFTREHGVGEVFPAGDAAGLAEATRAVLSDLASYRRRVLSSTAVAETRWSAQAERLVGLYATISPRPGVRP